MKRQKNKTNVDAIRQVSCDPRSDSSRQWGKEWNITKDHLLLPQSHMFAYLSLSSLFLESSTSWSSSKKWWLWWLVWSSRRSLLFSVEFSRRGKSRCSNICEGLSRSCVSRTRSEWTTRLLCEAEFGGGGLGRRRLPFIPLMMIRDCKKFLTCGLDSFIRVWFSCYYLLVFFTYSVLIGFSYEYQRLLPGY